MGKGPAPSAERVSGSGRANSDEGNNKSISATDSINTTKSHLPLGSMSVALLEEGIDPIVKELNYYHGLTPREDVESMLKRPGDFLLRKTDAPDANRPEGVTKRNRTMVISAMGKDRVARHYPVRKNDRGKYTLDDQTFCASVKDLIEVYRIKRIPMPWDGPVLQAEIKRQPWQLMHEQIRLRERLGAGAFGEVFRGTVLLGDSAAECAVKVATQGGDGQRGALTKEEQQTFLKEASMMRSLRHPHIIAMYGVACQEDPVMIVMEYATGGSLQNYLRKNKLKLRLVHRLTMVHDASKGMKYLESKQLVHRDVAARNCLIGARHEVKIADFGLSQQGIKQFRHTTAGRVPVKWMAPECLTCGIYSTKSDVWAFGVLVWEVFSDGDEPYPGLSNAETRSKICAPRTSFRMQLPDGTPPAMCKIVAQMWELKPDSRPTFKIIEKNIGKMLRDYEHSATPVS